MVEADNYGCRDLWAAVLLQAYRDCWIPPGSDRDGMIRKTARAWFRGADRDMQTVCSIVGIDWRAVRQHVLDQIEAEEPERLAG